MRKLDNDPSFNWKRGFSLPLRAHSYVAYVYYMFYVVKYIAL